jgi:hypothetical protein
LRSAPSVTGDCQGDGSVPGSIRNGSSSPVSGSHGCGRTPESSSATTGRRSPGGSAVHGGGGSSDGAGTGAPMKASSPPSTNVPLW